jgi:hypothetical protein
MRYKSLFFKREAVRCVLLTLFLILGWGGTVTAQDFKLYFANNLTDVTDFTKIEDASSPLEWREVRNNDMYGNFAEVNDVIKMFDSLDMKYRSHQRQFWKMRDHCLLCFRINDGQGKTGSYVVEIEDSVENVPQTITVSRYFYINAPRQGEEVHVRVYKMGDKNNCVSFKYRVYDWDDENLYVFQLDSKRQLSKESYRLQYVIGYTDTEGEFQSDTTTLALRDSSFQSFYVREGRDLLDVFLISGEESKPDEEHKLRLNKARLHTGVTLDPNFSATSLTAEFKHDKHENRELMNFNWIGSGLYERFDTLYVKLMNSVGEDIPRATFNIEAIDDKGERIPNEQGMKYIGYDRKLKQHKILTYGRPAYMEVIASGYVPRLYQYPGAADPKTRIVDEALCSATIQLLPNRNADGGIAMSSAHVVVLRDTKTVMAIGKTDYAVCDLEDFDITFRPAADTLYYVEDAGHQYPKVFSDKTTVSKYARMKLSFACPRGQSVSSVKLYGYDVPDEKEYTFTRPGIKTIDISDFPSFQYNYVDMDYRMVDILPQNTLCRLKMVAGDYTYEQFPFFFNMYIDREEMYDNVEKDINNQLPGTSNDERDAAFADQDFNFGFPGNFSLDLKPLNFTTSIFVNFTKQVMNIKASASYSQAATDKKRQTLRDEAKEFSKPGKETLYENGDTKLKWDGKGKTKFDDWILEEMNDIFSYSPATIGAGLFVTGTAAFDVPFGKNAGKGGNYIIFKQLGLSVGYGISLATPDLMNNYFTESSFTSLFNKLPCFHIGLNFDARVQLDAGITMYDTKGATFSSDSWGYYANVSGKAKVGAWAEFAVGNPVFAFSAGVRGGIKLGLGAGLAGPFRAQAPDVGAYALVVGGIEAYANIHSFIFNWSGRAGITFGKKWLFPDNDHNPFHSKYPYWIKKSEARSVAQSYRRVPLLGASTFGQTLVTDVAADANPHFIDGNHVVYNDLQDPSNYNDDRVTLLSFDDNSKTDLSQTETVSTRHMRSKRGNHEIVVFEELGRKIADGEIRSDNALEKSNELAAHTGLSARIKNVSTGKWEKSQITGDDGTVDTKPVVTIQDDGKAACVWQRGSQYTRTQTAGTDTLYSNALRGNLVLSIYNGKTWSSPVNLYSLDEDHVASEYDLIMRNDTVLVGTSITDYPLDSLRNRRHFSFASVDEPTKKVRITEDPINPIHFFMNRVGQHGVIAMLYEKNDSTRDIFVKTLAMSGKNNGIAGSDVGANYCSPNRVKIICDRAAESLNDFAILWTEMNNVAHNSGEEDTKTEEVRLMLNASRINLQPSPRITAPITVGCERDSLIMTDFDGFLDDARIKVVYSLSNIETGAAVIMTNEKYFTNSFEYDLSYPRGAVLASRTVPLNLEIRNTGTSGIRQVMANINGSDFTLDDSYVPPFQKRTFVVNYPIDDDFDGYISSDVTVDYDNVFKAKVHPTRGMSLRRQAKSKTMTNVGMEDIECRLIGHSVEDGVNNFVVELIDHSVRGLSSRNAVRVGIYAHSSVVEPLLDGAENIVTADDFSEIGGQRKAYTTVKVAGIREPLRAYLNTHIYNTDSTEPEEALIDNKSGNNNAHYITLLPHSDPTIVEQILKDGTYKMVSFTVKDTDGGVRISGLKKGTHLRIFTVNGVQVYNKKDVANETFVPLRGNTVYLISDGSEILKYIKQ